MEAQNSQNHVGHRKVLKAMSLVFSILLWSGLGASCAYTTVQSTGGYGPRESRESANANATAEEGRWERAVPAKKKKVVRKAVAGKSSDAEKRFFEKMSRKDPAFGGKAGKSVALKPKPVKKTPAPAPTIKKTAVKRTAPVAAKTAPITKTAAVKKRTAAMKKMEPTGTSYFQPRENGTGDTAGKTSLVSYGPSAKKAEKKPAKLFGDAGKHEYYQIGVASWYGPGFNGRPTASGEVFNTRKLTAAHRDLPLGSIIIVRNLENGREVVLRVNDRGPFVKGRILDVSEYASERLDFKERGLTNVGLKIIRKGKGKSKKAGATKFVYAKKSVDRPGKKTAEKPAPLKKKIRLDKKDYKSEKVLKDFFSIQVGLFENEFNANSLKFALKKFKLPIFVLKRGKMYVVKLGKFVDRKAAEALRQKLNDAGFTAFITGN